MDLLKLAKDTADRIEAQSVRAKVPVAVCVIDIHGNIVLKHRMNGAPTFSIDIAERKAYTSALVGQRTADLSGLVQPGQGVERCVGARMLVPVDDDRLFLALRDGDRHDLLRQPAVGVRGHSLVLAAHGKSVLIGPADGKLLGDWKSGAKIDCSAAP